MSAYQFTEIEKKWQKIWAESGLYKVENDTTKPKYYALDMFPYPSGAGLHVGHPLGYIASDIVSRYKRLNGYNVLHPMGYDAFGLPAEQYAIQTGQHPAVTTEKNIETFRRQLDIMGFSFDWSRQVRTSDPNYYQWTQWIFGLFFTHWYDKNDGKAKPLAVLIAQFEKNGTDGIAAACSEEQTFSALDWLAFDEVKKDAVLNNYRLAFMDETTVNWCEALGTVLANEEVTNGVSERGGHPVVRKKMKQWALRITAYADRLIDGLDRIDWSDSIKEIQRNWIGRSEGAEIQFDLSPFGEGRGGVKVFTTRPDTIFGATFMVLAPEYEGLADLCTAEQKKEVIAYAEKAKNRSEIDRMADTKKTGVFTGNYCINPFTKKPIPIWVSDYVLAGYGTGAIMAVPAHDERDFEFAKTFNLPIIAVIKPADDDLPEVLEQSFSAKNGVCFNSDFLNGLDVKNAISRAIEEVEKLGIGSKKINYKLREAGFGRQRYWGEPFPIIYDEKGVPHLTNELPVELPAVESYKPTGNGESPLAAVKEWVNTASGKRETDTMPGWAGSSWYFLRYMDPNNRTEFASTVALEYWKQVDLYIGGSEHATGHLLYSRFWTKFLFDLGYISWDEPFKKLVNQGMIQGVSNFLPTIKHNVEVPVIDQPLVKAKVGILVAGISYDEYLKQLKILGNEQELIKLVINRNKDSDKYKLEEFELIFDRIPIDYTVDNGKNVILNSKIKQEDEVILRNNYLKKHLFETNNFNVLTNDNEETVLKTESEKMSKSKWNVISPDDVIRDYGADTLRMYEMFLGPLTDSKPWNTHGIEGVSRFLGKFWRLFYEGENFAVTNEKATPEELKILHKTIKKITWDIDNMSFNTSVSAFMVATNELGTLKCKKREILEPLLILLAPFAPHITEELWEKIKSGTKPDLSPLQHGEGPGERSIHLQTWPLHDEKYLTESSFSYPVSINGKTRTQMAFPMDTEIPEIEKAVLSDATVQKWLDGKTVKKMIVVKGRIVNVVV